MIPDFQSAMLPLLKLAGDQQEHSIRESIDSLAEKFKLNGDERNELLPSGIQRIFDNRVGWARTHLKKAMLIEPTRRGHFRITPRGLEVLKKSPARIDIKFLNQFQEFLDFRTSKKADAKPLTDDDDAEASPEEELEKACQDLRDSLAAELLQQLKSNSPRLFEETVVRLLVKMGYGGTLRDAGEAVGRSGDEGIDGIIKEDRLGLDVVYVQAKRWENTVGRPEIQKFAGALQGQRARRGIFITTSDFSREAREYASRIDTRIVLIDGTQLTQLMIDHNVGVTPQVTYEVKRIDSDYFSEE